MNSLSEQDRALLNCIQSDFPLDSRPFATIAKRLGITEEAVLQRLQDLERDGAISRFGAVFNPNVAGASTLVSMAVAEDDVEAVADIVNAIPGVNHNYLREHRYNLWFVVTGRDREDLNHKLEQIRDAVPAPMLDLPMEQPYHIDLGFSL